MLKPSNTGLTVEESNQLKHMITEYADIFAFCSFEMGLTDMVHHTINTGGQVPIRQAPWHVPFTLRRK